MTAAILLHTSEATIHTYAYKPDQIKNAIIPGIIVSLVYKHVRPTIVGPKSLAPHRTLKVPIAIARDEELVPKLAGLVRILDERLHGDAVL
jgi:hypothetical protein